MEEPPQPYLADADQPIDYVRSRHDPSQVTANPIVADVKELGPVCFPNPYNKPLTALLLDYADFVLNSSTGEIIYRGEEEVIGRRWHHKDNW